jgi:hypothetical protein
MSLVRVVLLVAAAVLFGDYKYGKGRLIDAVSAEMTHLGDAASRKFSAIARPDLAVRAVRSDLASGVSTKVGDHGRRP